LEVYSSEVERKWQVELGMIMMLQRPKIPIAQSWRILSWSCTYLMHAWPTLVHVHVVDALKKNKNKKDNCLEIEYSTQELE